MKKSRRTASQILSILKQNESGASVPDLCHEHGMSTATFYQWRSKYGGMDASLITNGRHPIQLPDFPHDLGRSYISRASKAMTWFYLGTGNAIQGRNDRYLHPGRISAGCLTVTDISKWNLLYAELMMSRAPGGKNVGTITVQG